MTTTTQLPTAAQLRVHSGFAAIENRTRRQAMLREVANWCGISIAAAHKHAQSLADVHGMLLRVGKGYQTPDAAERLNLS